MNKRQKKKQYKKLLASIIQKVRQRSTTVTITPTENLDGYCTSITETVQNFYTDIGIQATVDTKFDNDKQLFEIDVTVKPEVFGFDLVIPNKDETV